MRAILLSILLGACAGPPQREETAPPLVVPPLGPAATSEHAHETPREIASVLAVPARDPRAEMREPRSPAAIRAEIATLEQEHVPSALHALADAYCELARAEGSRSAREKAVEAYDELVTKFPSYAALDEALYFEALEQEILGDKTKARRTYFELIKRRPDSKLVPYAYFAFGEMFFEESKTDPTKKPLAEQAYGEVAKFPECPLATEAKNRLDELARR